MAHKRRKKSERNAIAPYPKVETSRKVVEYEESNSYNCESVKVRRKVKTVDGYTVLSFTKKIERIRGEYYV